MSNNVTSQDRSFTPDEQGASGVQPKKISTLAHMIFDPPLDIKAIISEGNSLNFQTSDEWTEFIQRKTWEAAI